MWPKIFENLRQPFVLYLLCISIVGIFLPLRGIIQFPSYDNKLTFLVLVLLGAATQIATTSVPVGQNAGITYAISPAVGMAATPFYGPLASVIIEFVNNIVLWLIKPTDNKVWKKSWSQLGFNNGNGTISIFFASWILMQTQTWWDNSLLFGSIIPWVLAAIIYNQSNLWLLIGILRLQHGAGVNPWQVWRENLWTVPMGTLILSVGGSVLAYAVQQYDRVGILVFFLPIFLSAYAFRLYVNKMQGHMDNLENIIAERTKELEEANKSLRDLHREKNAFLTVLTHDMKTPLTSIGLYGNLLREQPKILLQRPYVIDAIMHSQKSLLNMVNNILDLEKLDSGKPITLLRKRFDLAELVIDTVKAIQVQASEKEIILEVNQTIIPLYLNADPRQIERVLSNLISNAIKYTAEGGHVWVETYQQDEWVTITVRDTGYGIPESDLPYIFNRYHRVDKLKNKASGTGLGLAVTKALVDAHQGQISVSSQEGAGSCFTVMLPLPDMLPI